ncbi:MAG: DUF5683 domain-containing protein [Longimicrobiales bacterium]|nr:DUF5683 domain-containing protein [Longimicrobiales bacterium]
MTHPRPATVPALAAALALASVLPGPAPTVAQEPDTLRAADTLRVDSVRPVPRVPLAPAEDTASAPTTPSGAMVRSFILPGWGQAEFDAYFRGGVYFAGWAGNWFMNFRNAYRLDHARERLAVRRSQIEDQLIASSSNPDSLRAQIDSFPTILTDAVRADSLGNELRKIVSSREQQREDWIAWSVFWLLASGIDAYVTAHLAEFPADIELRPGRQGGMSLRVGVPWPGRPGRDPPARGRD